jgi:ABC-type polysaccharide/polyol phosphate export permease
VTEFGSTGMDAKVYEALVSRPVLMLGALSATPLYALMAFGFVLAVMGHIFRDYRIVGIGIFVLFLATALLFLGAYHSYQDHGPLDF